MKIILSAVRPAIFAFGFLVAESIAVSSLDLPVSKTMQRNVNPVGLVMLLLGNDGSVLGGVALARP